MTNIFGDPSRMQGSGSDLPHLAEQVAQAETPRPRLYQWCGRDDFLYQQNVRFRQLAKRLGLDLNYSEGPGDHTWGYWDTQIQKVLDWIFQERR